MGWLDALPATIKQLGFIQIDGIQSQLAGTSNGEHRMVAAVGEPLLQVFYLLAVVILIEPI